MLADVYPSVTVRSAGWGTCSVVWPGQQVDKSVSSAKAAACVAGSSHLRKTGSSADAAEVASRRSCFTRRPPRRNDEGEMP